MDPKKKKTLRIMIVAGEDSGDAHAAHLVDAIRRALPDSQISFFGAAGKKMRETGVEAIVESDDFGIVGVPEVLKAVPMFLRVLRQLSRSAKTRKADLAILVDFPEFNLKLAKRLKRNGICVVYYISPQLWAWRSYRSRGIAEYVDLMLTILPFEKDWYRERGINHVEYVGNPLTGKVKSSADRNDFRMLHGFDGNGPLVALLPGSRTNEIKRILPRMIETAVELHDDVPGIQFGVAASNSRNLETVTRIANSTTDTGRLGLKFLTGATYDLLNCSDAAIVTSGTATLETMLIGTPQLIVYKTSALNFTLLKRFVSAEQFGLPNIVAGREVFRELLQDEFTAETASQEVKKLLEENNNLKLRREASAIAKTMGDQDSSELAAQKIIRFAGWN